MKTFTFKVGWNWMTDPSDASQNESFVTIEGNTKQEAEDKLYSKMFNEGKEVHWAG